MDIVFIHDLAVDCIIGVWDWERELEQRIYIDLDLAVDISKAATSDRLDDTLNYKAVAQQVSTYAVASKCQLVERLAEGIATLLREEFAIPWCRVRINKHGALSRAGDVGVIIERGGQHDA
ncbi:MAG TPA: dihydroneopterin aldolase [Gammaproteobacteria bacterium]|nr:dihydroneopterin aldolase [Gammaproteobacteria bacterium]